MPEYTPTTAEARALYVTGTPRDISVAEGNAEFDRWLAAHDAEQRETGRLAALKEAAEFAQDMVGTALLVDVASARVAKRLAIRLAQSIRALRFYTPEMGIPDFDADAWLLKRAAEIRAGSKR